MIFCWVIHSQVEELIQGLDIKFLNLHMQRMKLQKMGNLLFLMEWLIGKQQPAHSQHKFINTEEHNHIKVN